jgi:predicted porin
MPKTNACLPRLFAALSITVSSVAMAQTVPPSAAPAAPTPLAAPTPPASAVPKAFLERKPGEDVTFLTALGEITVYGNLDVSFDAATKGISGLSANGVGPVGNTGWMPDISSNLSYVGVKGVEHIAQAPFAFVYQLETLLEISATSGVSASNAQEDLSVKGGLTSRNSYIGISSVLGSIKVGKTDAPYKTATTRMNPFAGMWGDYAVIMGNTGGDNRVELGTRLDHAVWYESPRLAGLQLRALYAPGQNRGYDDEQIPAGESSCAGGNIPGSGGTVPVGCTDGGFGDAFSTSLTFDAGPVYAVAAYELHRGVNRTSDLATLDPTGNLLGYDANDIADEDAMKAGLQIAAPSGTTVGGIFERMNRHVPAYLQVQNERTRSGWWLTLSQELGSESVHLGWAHAMRANGDPGQHNSAPATGIGTLDADNQADMFTVALKHHVGGGLTFYADYAVTLNHAYAHYDLGAGGRGVTTDCHDAQLPALGDATSSPHCWAGGTLQGVSVGAHYHF